jgi:hypothetical protein
MTNAVPIVHSKVDTVIFLALFGGLAAMAFAASSVIAVRTRNLLAVFSCLGALACSLNEPIYDYLGKIVYASNSTTAYTAFGRHIPLFLVLGYVPWLGFLSYLVSRLMAKGVRRERLWLIATGSFLSVVVIETLGNISDSWHYYGTAPLKYLGVAPQMAPVPILTGMLLFILDTQLRGWRRVFAMLAPMLALPAVYAAAGFPIYVGLYSHISKPVQYLAGIVTLALCAAIVFCCTWAAEAWRRFALPTADAAPGSDPVRADESRVDIDTRPLAAGGLGTKRS